MKKNGAAKRPTKEKIIVIASAVLIALIALSIIYFFSVGALLYNISLARGESMPTNGGEESTPESEWWDSFDKSVVTMTSDDGLLLSSYEFLQKIPSHLWAINIHGYRGNAKTMSAFAKQYYENGFNVLAPDLRAHGNSEGGVIGMGWIDRLDMMKWIDGIVARDADAQIILHGVSMGGATVMMTTGETLPANVVAAVEDCGYTTVYEQFSYVAESVIGIPSFLAMPEGAAMIQIKTGRDIRTESSLEQLKKSVTPTLFIHGKDDDFVPFSMLQPNFDAAACEKEILVVPSAGHAQSAKVAPELYWSSVFTFLHKHVEF